MAGARVPKLKEGQYSVILSEVMTGIVLNLDGTRHTGPGKYYEAFDSQHAAEAYGLQRVTENHLHEAWVRDHEGRSVKYIRHQSIPKS